ncbi:hypothetical protein AB0L82_43110 [Nocardia sp. NPDC052001]|uniref:hypothetical protein n=1 Tax=Nocardia sp. NPDC052001 TaxID=3154853 RepID=UPI0034211C33
MKTRVREVHVPVVLAVPAVGGLIWGFVLAVVWAAVLAVAISLSNFSDGNSTVPSELGPCEPFCAMRSSVAPLPQGGELR